MRLCRQPDYLRMQRCLYRETGSLLSSFLARKRKRNTKLSEPRTQLQQNILLFLTLSYSIRPRFRKAEVLFVLNLRFVLCVSAVALCQGLSVLRACCCLACARLIRDPLASARANVVLHGSILSGFLFGVCAGSAPLLAFLARSETILLMA